MPLITTETGEQFECLEDDTLVRGALRNGFGFPYECNAGACGTCKFTLVEGEVRDLYPDAPALSERDVRKGRKLGCQCQPVGDIQVRVHFDEDCVPVHRPVRQSACLVSTEAITHDISAFSFNVPNARNFRPGQFAMISVPGIGERAYSMSNRPNENLLEFQIKKMPDGAVSGYLFEDSAIMANTQLSIDGPFGVAYYRSSNRDKICIAGGSGLAPMVSVAREHIALDAPQKLHFFFGGKTDRDLLLNKEFLELIGADDVSCAYHPIASEGTNNAETLVGFPHEALLDFFSADELKNHDIYCAGPSIMTNAIEAQLFDIGFPSSQLFFDRFS